MGLPAVVQSAVDSWADLYGNHQLVSVTVRYLHLAGLVVGGGTALAADRQVLRAALSGPLARSGVLSALHGAHRVVVPALVVVVATGLAMTLSDTETFLVSPLYWSKMALVGLLLLNGVALVAAERAVTRERPKSWVWLTATSAASLLLWLGILFAGVWLTVAA
ncbi:MAG: hypothetical protein LJF15_18915 [Acidobacteria bacterium]|jgi:hypothetical protein|nr:hypothetical protein [Acidobacteriota bacterium]